MQRLEALLFDFGFLGYAAALGFYLAYALTRREPLSLAGRRILWVAVSVHALSLALGLAMESRRPDHVAYAYWSNWFESLSLFSLLMAGVFLAVQRRGPLGILGVFVLPLAVLLMGAAITQAFLASPRCPFASVEDFLRILDASRSLPRPPASPWLSVHVPLVFFAYAAFANAFGVGLAFLVQERQLKSRRPTALCYRLPSLEEMDRIISRLVLAAFPALTVGLALGAHWARSAWSGAWAADIKILWSVAVWGVYAVYLGLRYGAGWRGRRTAYLSLAGFGLSIVGYVAVNSLSRVHGFMGGG